MNNFTYIVKDLYLKYRVTHKGLDFNDDIKLLKGDIMEVCFSSLFLNKVINCQHKDWTRK